MKPLTILERFEGMEAGRRLRRKLGRENPGIFIYGGITLERPPSITVYATKHIEVPEVWAGYNVVFGVRGNGNESSS